MNWQQTTLRKGTKSPRICRDMFITDSRGDFRLTEVKNGKQVSSKNIDEKLAKEFINRFMLFKTGSCFNNCFTYRDYKSTKLVNELLSS